MLATSQKRRGRTVGDCRGTTCRLGALLLGLSVVGCAINDRGLVRVRHWEAPGGRVVQLDGWGVHLTTLAADRGITLGRSSRTYFCPTAETLQSGSVDAGDLLSRIADSTVKPVDPGSAPALSELESPVAVISRSTGLVVDVNSFRTGLSLGVRTFGGVILPQDFEGLVWLHYRSEHPEESSIFVQENTR